MSKEGLEKLNQNLLKHFEETGITNALYYEPIKDFYWEQKNKICICNLEPYDNKDEESFSGINKLTNEFLLDYCIKSPTVQKTLKFCKLVNMQIENGGKYVQESDAREIDSKKYEDLMDNFNHFFYCNLRLTIGKDAPAAKQAILSFYKDPFYIDYFKKLMKETQVQLLFISSELGVEIMNQIYPGLELEYNGKIKEIEGMKICSMQHPSRISYKDMVDTINYGLDMYLQKS